MAWTSLKKGNLFFRSSTLCTSWILPTMLSTSFLDYPVAKSSPVSNFRVAYFVLNLPGNPLADSVNGSVFVLKFQCRLLSLMLYRQCYLMIWYELQLVIGSRVKNRSLGICIFPGCMYKYSGMILHICHNKSVWYHCFEDLSRKVWATVCAIILYYS